MKKFKRTDKVHTKKSAYASLITTEGKTSESDQDVIEMFEGMSGGIEQDLTPYQDLAEQLIEDSGNDPKDYLSLIKSKRHSPAWIGANILFYLNATRDHMLSGNVEDAVWAALRLAEMKTIYFIKLWEIDARVGRNWRELGREGGSSRSPSEEKRNDWQRRADRIFEKNPRLSKTSAAHIISKDLSNEGEEQTSFNTIRQHIHKES